MEDAHTLLNKTIMKKNKAQKDILYLSISSFILTALWISFNVYHSYVSTTIAPTLQLQIQPIEPSFDLITIQNLKNRKSVVPQFDFQTSQNSSSEGNINSQFNIASDSTDSANLTETDDFIQITGE